MLLLQFTEEVLILTVKIYQRNVRPLYYSSKGVHINKCSDVRAIKGGMLGNLAEYSAPEQIVNPVRYPPPPPPQQAEHMSP